MRGGATTDRAEYAPFRIQPDDRELVTRHFHAEDFRNRNILMGWAILYCEAMRAVAACREKTRQQITAFLASPYDPATGQYIADVKRYENYPFLELRTTKNTQFSIEAQHREYPNQKDRAYARFDLSDHEGIVVQYYAIEHYGVLPRSLNFGPEGAQRKLRGHLDTVVALLNQLLPKVPEPVPRYIASR